MVEIPIETAMNWVGVEKEEVAAKVFSAAGVPSKAIVSGGKISSLEIEHTWVEAYVNYGNYRGVDNDGGPKAWVALDGSFKEMEYKKPLDILGGMDVDIEAFAGEVTSAALFSQDGNALLSYDTSSIQARLGDLANQAVSYVETSTPDATVEDLTGTKKIIGEELGLLPNSLSLPALSVTSEYANVPDDWRYKVSFGIDDNSGAQLAYTDSLSALAGKRIIIGYVSATEADRESPRV